MSRLEFRNVTVCFGTGRRTITAVNGVDLDVPDGHVVGLVGESGSGKSTLAAAAVGLVQVSSGEILLDNVNIANVRRAKARNRLRIQLVFQSPYSSLDPRMTIGESIIEAIPSRRRTGQERSFPRRGRKSRDGDEVRRLLSLVHLDPNLERVLPRQLSGGMLQRVALARALAAQPHVIIADEITTALDVSVQGSVLNLVRELQRELGLTMVFISHHLAIVRYVSDVIAVMRNGCLVEVAPTEQLISAPEHPYTRMLLDCVPRLGEPLPSTLTAGPGATAGTGNGADSS